MGMQFPQMMIGRELGDALFGILSQDERTILLRTDGRGYVEQASSPIDGPNPTQIVPAPSQHIIELFHPQDAATAREALRMALAGAATPGRIECRLAYPARGSEWVEVTMHRLSGEDPQAGLLVMLRSIAERVSLKERLFAAEFTDPLTGTANRRAFLSMLDHLGAGAEGGCVALFSIDYFMGINLRYGHAVGDEVLVVFADLMREIVRRDDVIARIGGETFGVLFPAIGIDRAEELGRQVIATLSDAQRAVTRRAVPITASGGIAEIGATLDETLEQVELALFSAKANGRNRFERTRLASPRTKHPSF